LPGTIKQKKEEKSDECPFFWLFVSELGTKKVHRFSHEYSRKKMNHGLLWSKKKERNFTYWFGLLFKKKKLFQQSCVWIEEYGEFLRLLLRKESLFAI
jgi:hypothetical protein